MLKTSCLLAVLLLFGLPMMSVHAQDAGDGEDSQPSKVKLRLEQVTVSATKTKRDTLTTPGEVSVLTQEYFQQRQAQSLDDVLRYEPGVTTGSGPRTMAEGPNIRGLSGDRVLTLLDGMRLTFQSGHKGRTFIDMDQLKQVEVIRGPGSALYGSQAVGGVVAMETKDPSDYLAPDMKYGIRQKFGYQYANEELLSTTTLSIRLTDQVAVMTSGTFRAGENVRLGGDLGRLDNSAQDTAANLSKFVWRPTPYDEAEFSVQATRQAAQIPFQANSMPTQRSSIADRVNRQITYRLGYTHNDPANRYLDLRGFVYLTTLDVTESRITDPDQRDDFGFDTFGYDIRNSMNFGDPSTHHHIVTFGSEYFRNKQESKGSRYTSESFVYTPGQPCNPRAGLLPPRCGFVPPHFPTPIPAGLTAATTPLGAETFFPSAKADTFALYVQDEMTIIDRVTLIPALRWDNWENRAPGRETKSVGVLNPKIGTVIQVTDFLFLTANYAHGFRQPTFGELFISGTHLPGSVFRPNPDLKPERSRNIDAGFRLNVPKVLSGNDQLIFKGTYFRNTFKDFIDFVSGGTGRPMICNRNRPTNIPGPPPGFDPTQPVTIPCPFIDFRQGFVLGTLLQQGQPSIQTFRNVPDALIHGVEAEFEWHAHENVVLSGNYTFTHGTDQTNGRPINNIPPNRGVLGIDYFYDAWGLNLGARSQMVADQDRVPVSDDPFVAGTPTPGYVLFDIWANVQPAKALLPDLPKSWLQGFRLNLGVDNLTDRNYRRHLSSLPEAGVNPKISFWYSINLP